MRSRRTPRLRDTQKGRRPKPTPLRTVQSERSDYIFFSSHTLVVAFQVPPAFAQSASVFAAVTSPAKAGPVKASARVNAKIERRVFMAVRVISDRIDQSAESTRIAGRIGDEDRRPRRLSFDGKIGPRWRTLIGSYHYLLAFDRLEGSAKGIRPSGDPRDFRSSIHPASVS